MAKLSKAIFTEVSCGRDARADFREFQEKVVQKDPQWLKADIHHEDGLTLFYEDPDKDMTVGFRLLHIPCGFEGTESMIAVDILYVAGFGDRDRLSDIVFSRPEHTFFRTP